MLKLYRRHDKTLHYHEAWIAGDVIVEHWGIVGQRGTTKDHPRRPRESHAKALRRVLTEAEADGFRPLSPDDHATLLVEYAVDGFGSTADLEFRSALEARMNEALGWTGLGCCDGGSIGSGTMEVCCLVVDAELAKTVIARELSGTPFAHYLRIYDEDAT